MYCTQCGAANDDQAQQCSQCKAALVRPGVTGAPIQGVPSYLLPSILVTIFCCQVPGIVAILYAAHVNGALAAGEFQKARRYSRLAGIWCLVAVGVTLLLVVAIMATIFIAALANS